MSSLFYPLILVAASLSAGYIFGRIYDSKKRKVDSVVLRKWFQRIALLLINPVAFLGAVWVAPIQDLRIIGLPFTAAVAILSGGLLSFLFARLRKLERKQVGSLITVGGFTNIGSIGGVVVFFLLGEAGFSLVPVYKLFEELLYYGVGFPVAKSFSDHSFDREHRIKALARDPFILTMLTAIITGTILNFSGVIRPGWYGGLNEILIPLATVILIFSIGMAFKFVKMGKYISKAAVIVVIKNFLVPVIAVSFAFLLGLHRLENGLVIQTVLILSAMPAGFISLVPPTIYGLDLDLSNTAWLGTMISLLWMVPLLKMILPLVS